MLPRIIFTRNSIDKIFTKAYTVFCEHVHKKKKGARSCQKLLRTFVKNY